MNHFDIPPAVLETLVSLPRSPGIYQMYGASGIIYVGKAKNLLNRVSSYFKPSTKHTPAKASMVTQIRRIEIIETQTEIEALVLETNLIKSLKPKYNILMKDDKNLSYIHLTTATVGEVRKTRSKVQSGETFGPYTSYSRLSQTLASLKRVFRVRSCQMQFEQQEGKIIIKQSAGRSIPCLDYYIGLCPAPCTLEASKLQAHRDNIEALRGFLRGNKKDTFAQLESQMREQSEKREYENAQKTKSLLDSLTHIYSSHQIVRDAIEGDYDICILTLKHDICLFSRLLLRGGEVRSLTHQEINNPLDEEAGILLAEAIVQSSDLTEHQMEHSVDLLLHEALSDAARELLSDAGIEFEVPLIGAKREVVNFVRHNAGEYLHRKALDHISDRSLNRSGMENILIELGYSVPPQGEKIIFECYDISHTDGRFTVASRSVLVNGESQTSLYRKYSIKDLPDGKIDDFASMREVMYRRMLEGGRESNFPHLIIIDGGKGQLSSAIEGLERAQKELNQSSQLPSSVSLPQICSLAKRLEEVFLPYERESIRFEVGSSELRIYQKIRDEAHRFAITFNRSKRSKEMKKNILEDIPGIGPTTRKKLLSKAGSLDAIVHLSREDLSTIVNKSQLAALIGHGIWIDK